MRLGSAKSAGLALFRVSLKSEKNPDSAVQDLITFVQLCDQDKALQQSLSAADSPAAIFAIAHDAGFAISLSQLKQAAPALSATYWPWSGKGFRYLARFFKP